MSAAETPDNTIAPHLGYLRLRQVLKLVPVSKSTWWEGCKTGRYPKAHKLRPRVTAWKANDIYRLLHDLEQKNDQRSS